MTTPEIIQEIAQRTGLAENKVRKAVFDFSRDINTIVTSKATGGFILPGFGYLYVSMKASMLHLDVLIRNIELYYARHRKHLAQNMPMYRTEITGMIDDFYATVNLIMENQLIKNENYKRGPGKKVAIDMAHLAELRKRMDNVLDDFPSTFIRKEHTEIQKICLRRLSKQGILQSPGGKDPAL